MAAKKTGGVNERPSRAAAAKASKPAPSKPRKAPGKVTSTRKAPSKAAPTEALRGGRRSAKGPPEFEQRGALVIWHRSPPAPGVKKSRMPSAQQLAEMIEEATVDAYNDDEKAGSWYTVLSDNLELPFTTEVLGVAVQVVQLDLTSRNEIVAVCKRGSKLTRVPLLDLDLPDPPPEGFAWVEAYRQWCG
jgi:hypothetical protein